MGIFNKIFKKKENDKDFLDDQIANRIINQQTINFNDLANEKKADEPVSNQALIAIFNTYFAPNKEFYAAPGSPKFNAYFSVVNSARDELLNNPQLFTEATKWSMQDLAKLLNSSIPGITNMLICGLIFKLGEFAVIKDAVYCVDFSENIPNSIALYLLLIAQRLPNDKKTQIIDAGEGTNKEPLLNAMKSLEVCDANWNYKIW